MATAYAGYGGEFSSDEDIDKMEQQSERLVQSNNFPQQVKPTKRQVDEVIETVRKLPIDQDIQLSDELISGLLDHFKTQRGPIVDSTRNLYKKIVLRLIREQQQQPSELNRDTNGNINNNVINNNNNISPSKQQVEMAASSDEDEPMPPVSTLEERRKFDSRVVYNEPMEVDQETPSGGAIRSKKQVDMSTTDEDDDDNDDDSSETSSSETEESTEEEEDSEELDITPVKPTSVQVPTKTVGPKSAVEPTPLASKTTEQSVKKSKPAIGLSSTPVDQKKKPYTRSQRMVATRSSSAKKLDVSSSKDGQSSTDVFAKQATKSSLSSKFRVRYLLSALLIAVIAFFLYYFRSDLTKSTNRIVSRAINF